MYFDTHAHYDSSAFDTDREDILAAINNGGVELVVDPGCDVASSELAVELSRRYDFMYAAVGIHPEELLDNTPQALLRIKQLAKEDKVVAIGEIGLDYYWDKQHKQEQKELFTAQLETALELDKPVIIHDRDAHGDSLEIVGRYPGLRGVFHCYSGSAEMAAELLKAGWYLGFDGPVTYKNARKQVEVLEMCPIERILIETDSPYMTPVPHRGERNDSRMLAHIAAKVAELKGITAEEAARITKENGMRLFKIGDFA